MTIILQVFGPYELPVSGKLARSVKQISDADRRQFLAELADLGLADKHGCYVFALRAGRGYCPWYIGKTNRSLAAECMGPHQLTRYNEVLFQGKKGTPVMFFVCPEGRKKALPNEVCNDLEWFLINQAFMENDALGNDRKLLPPWSIKGVFGMNRGRPSKDEHRFQLMMGL